MQKLWFWMIKVPHSVSLCWSMTFHGFSFRMRAKWKMDCHQQQQHIIFSLTHNHHESTFLSFYHTYSPYPPWKFNLTTLDVKHQSSECDEKGSLKVFAHSFSCLHQQHRMWSKATTVNREIKQATAKPVKMLEKLCIK